MSPFVWTDEAVRAALGLRTERARPGVEFTGVSTDSRSVEPGALYVALVGDTFNGHDFVADALAAGAAGAVVSQMYVRVSSFEHAALLQLSLCQ